MTERVIYGKIVTLNIFMMFQSSMCASGNLSKKPVLTFQPFKVLATHLAWSNLQKYFPIPVTTMNTYSSRAIMT